MGFTGVVTVSICVPFGFLSVSVSPKFERCPWYPSWTRRPWLLDGPVVLAWKAVNDFVR